MSTHVILLYAGPNFVSWLEIRMKTLPPRERLDVTQASERCQL
jgi:hypothetical protein